MAHEFITYYSSDVPELFSSVGVPGVILSIDTESDTKTCDVATDKWGIIEDVPFFYHCEDNSTARGYTAFKTESQDPALSQVMLLVKNGLNNDKKPNPAYDEIKVIGFYDGKLRKCSNYKLIFRGKTDAKYSPYSYTDCNDLGGFYLSPYYMNDFDMCFVYDLKNENYDQEIKMIDEKGNPTLNIYYPIKYKDLCTKTDIFRNGVYADCPVASFYPSGKGIYLYYDAIQRLYNLDKYYPYKDCFSNKNSFAIAKEIIEAGGEMNRGDFYTRWVPNTIVNSENFIFSTHANYPGCPYNIVSTLISRECVVEIVINQVKAWQNDLTGIWVYAQTAFEHCRIYNSMSLPPYDPFFLDTIHIHDITTVPPINTSLLPHILNLMDAQTALAAAAGRFTSYMVPVYMVNY